MNAPPAHMLTPSTHNASALGGFDRVRRRTAQILTVVALLHFLVVSLLNALANPQLANRLFITVGIFAVIYLFLIILAQGGRVSTASTGLVLLLLVELYIGSGLLISAAVLLVLVTATLIINDILYLIYTVLTFVMLALVSVSSFAPILTETVEAETVPVAVQMSQLIATLGLIVALLGLSITVRFFRTNIERTSREAERNANLLRISAEVGQVTAGVTTLDELLPNAVNFIQTRFGYYHVQVFFAQ